MRPGSLQEALFLIRAGHQVPEVYQEQIMQTMFYYHVIDQDDQSEDLIQSNKNYKAMA